MPAISAIGKAALENIPKIKSEYLKGKSALTVTKDLFNDQATRANSIVESIIEQLREGGVDDPISKKFIQITEEELAQRVKPIGVGKGKFSYEQSPDIAQRIKVGAQSGMSKNEFLRANPDLNKQPMNRFLEVTGTTWENIGKAGVPFKPEVTENIKKVQEVLVNNPDANFETIKKLTRLPANELNNTISAFKASYKKIRPGFEPLESVKDSVSKLQTNIPITFEQSLDDILLKNDIDPSAVSKETRNKLLRSRKAVQEFFDSGTNFEHQLPKSLLKYVDDPDTKVDLLLTGSRTSPELNQFKLRYDRMLNGAVSRLMGTSKDGVKLSLKEYNNEVKRISDEVRKLTGGYEIGYLKFDKTGKATPVLPKAKSLLKGNKSFGPETMQKLSPFENVKYHNTLIKNYAKNPEDPAFNTLRKKFPEVKELSLYKDQAKAYKDLSKYLNVPRKQFMEYANKNINNPAVQAIFKSPYGKAAALTTVGLVPSKLSAEEDAKIALAANDIANTFEQEQLVETPTYTSDIEFGDPETWDKKVIDFMREYPIETGTAALGGTLATKTGRQVAKKIGQAAISTPAGALAFNALVGVNPKDPLERAFLEAELVAAPALVKGAEAMTKNQLLRKALTLGIGPRIAAGLSGVGITALVGEGLYRGGKYMLERKKLLESLTDEQREDLLSRERTEAIQQNLRANPEAFEGIMAASGGYVRDLLKDGGPTDPSKRKFMKLAAGIASIPLIGKYLKPAAKVAETAAPVAQKLIDGAPVHFWNLVNKIKKLGKDVTETQSVQDRQTVKQFDDYVLTEDMATGEKTIQRTKVDLENAPQYYDEPLAEDVYMNYKPSEMLEEGVKTKPEYVEETGYLRTQGPQQGDLIDEISGVPDDVIEEGMKFIDDK